MSLIRTVSGLSRGIAVAATLAATSAATVLSAPATHAETPKPVAPGSLSECPSNRFCTFSSPSFTGSVRHVGGAVVSRDLGWTVKSYWNNRDQAARLYSNNGSSSFCMAPGARRTTVAAEYQTPARVYLAGSENC